ncbi:MAG: DegV family protein [Anaerolineaceae bacterium]|nr:DegV family protein [Anaerolineaceae bacterium]
MSLAVVTDSTADLPTEIIQKYNIQVVPALLMIAGRTYLDGVGMSRDDFYGQLPTFQQPPTTSAPSMAVFQEIYTKLFQQGVSQILSIHVSSAFSSMHNIACAAAEAFQTRVQVIDSGQVTLGLGFQVIAAAEAAAKGIPVEEIIKLLRCISQRVKFIALLDTLEYVRRSGRVNWASAALANVLDLKVLIEVKLGQVYRLGLFRTRQKGLDSLIKHLGKVGPLENLAVVYTQLTDSQEIQTILAAIKLPSNAVPIVGPVTTVIGTHVGSNGVGFIAVSV